MATESTQPTEAIAPTAPMDQLQQDQLQQRLAKVERQARFLRRSLIAWMLLTLLAVLVWTVADAVLRRGPDIITARQVRLRDATGHLRAVLDADPPIPHLAFFDSAGKAPVLELGTEEDGSAYVALLHSNQHRMVMRVDKDGTPDLRMHDDAGRERLHLAVRRDHADKQECPGLFLNDAAGTERIRVEASDLGPSLALRDAAGVGRVYLFSFAGNQGIDLYDSSGRTRSTWGMWENTPRLAFLDEQRHRRLTMGWELDAVAVKFLDPREETRFELSLSATEAGMSLRDGGGNVRGKFTSTGDAAELTFLDRAGHTESSPKP